MNSRYQNSQNCRISSGEGILHLVLKVLLALTVLCVFVPLMPVMPSSEPLDPSWAIGINQAVAQGLRFGREVIFTFGPYASIYSKAFHPATEHLELVGSIYLALLYAVALLGVLKHANLALLIGMWLLLAGFTTTYDSLFFSYGLLVGIYCLQAEQITVTASHRNKLIKLAIVALLFSGFGLYPLIKGTLFAFYGVIAGLSMIFYAWNKKWLYVAIIPVSMAVSMLGFWMYSGQHIGDLPAYYFSISSIISGYTDAMSIDGSQWEVISYAITAILLAVYILQSGRWTISNLYLLFIFSLFLFINFKAGFVRHDQHSLMCGVSIVFATILVLTLRPSKTAWSILILALVTLLLTEGAHKKHIPSSAAKQVISTYSSTWTGAQLRLLRHDQLVTDFDKKLKALNAAEPLPHLPGKSDIYPFDQIYLIASNNEWAPRPVLQSYSAYNSTLAKIDAAFLTNNDSPDNIFFRLATIDGRYPSSDDGNSWPILLRKYQLKNTIGSYLILKKNQDDSSPINFRNIISETRAINSWIELPNTTQELFASIDIKHSLLGWLKNIFYKSSHLGIAVRLDDGSTKYFRLVSGNVSSNFLLSPLIENTEQFGWLYTDPKLLNKNKVKAISIWVEGSTRDWQSTYELTLKTLD